MTLSQNLHSVLFNATFPPAEILHSGVVFGLFAVRFRSFFSCPESVNLSHFSLALTNSHYCDYVTFFYKPCFPKPLYFVPLFCTPAFCLNSFPCAFVVFSHLQEAWTRYTFHSPGHIYTTLTPSQSFYNVLNFLTNLLTSLMNPALRSVFCAILLLLSLARPRKSVSLSHFSPTLIRFYLSATVTDLD